MSTKIEVLLQLLETDWTTTEDLCNRFGWQRHTLRAAISGLGKKRAVVRRRENGITSYRIAEAG